MTLPDFAPHSSPPDEERLTLLVRAFEQGTLPRERWTHAAHLAVGSHYVFTLGHEAAVPVMRSGVRAYNEAVGTPNTDTRGYHETLTRIWLLTLARLMQAGAPASRTAFAQLAVERYGNRRDLHRSLYSFDVVNDVQARREWVEPDLPLPLGILR